MTFLQVVYAETRREIYRMRTYYVEFLAAQLFFLLGFLMLSGLFELISDGQYSDRARLVSIIGFLTWQVADGCLIRTARSFAEDAQWGTLEQVWLSALPPVATVTARGLVVLFFNSLKALLNGVILIAIFGVIPPLSPAMLLIFLLTQFGVFGLTYVIVGLHLVYKSVESITFVLSTALLFVSGALTPLHSAPLLNLIGLLLPLGWGVQLLQALILEPVSLPILLMQPEFYGLIIHSLTYALTGWLILTWGQQTARNRGYLGHY